MTPLNIFATCSARVIIPTICQRANLSISAASLNVFDKKTWYRPLKTKEEAKVGLSITDPRFHKYARPMRSDSVPTIYKDDEIELLIRMFMSNGEKEKTRAQVYYALENVKRKRYMEWKKMPDGKEKDEYELNPITITKAALKNMEPSLVLRGHMKGGIMYQIPMPMWPNQAKWRAMKSLRIICEKHAKGGRPKGNAYFRENLAKEILDGYENKGWTVQSKLEYHKRCEANKAYAHYMYKSSKG